MKVSSSTVKSFISSVSKIKTLDFAVKDGIFGKDLFGTVVVCKMKDDVSFHALSEKHMKMLLLFSSNCEFVDIENDDQFCYYKFIDSNNKVISSTKIPHGAFEMTDVKSYDKVTSILNNYNATFLLPTKIASKMIEIVSDISTITIKKQGSEYVMHIDYHDNTTQIQITPQDIKKDITEVKLPVGSLLLASLSDSSNLYLADEQFMLALDISEELKLYIISTYDANSEEILKLSKDISVEDLL